MNESFAGNLFQMALTWFLVLPLLLCAVGNHYVHRVGSMKDWERLQRAWRWGRHWMWSTHWWGRDWGLHQASSDWDHETTMAPLGRPALPTRPYPNICGTAQFSILLGSLCYLFGLLYQLSWMLGPNKWQNFSLPLAICCFASGPSSTLSDILNPFKAISPTVSGH